MIALFVITDSTMWQINTNHNRKGMKVYLLHMLLFSP